MYIPSYKDLRTPAISVDVSEKISDLGRLSLALNFLDTTCQGVRAQDLASSLTEMVSCQVEPQLVPAGPSSLATAGDHWRLKQGATWDHSVSVSFC